MKHALQLYFHPLSSYCWKVLIALYESKIEFEPRLVKLGEPASRAAFLSLCTLGKLPVLRDGAAGRVVPESSIILEYLADTHPTARWLIPAEPHAAREVRLRDRIFDLHLQTPMQRIVSDRLRPRAERDPAGVRDAQAALATALGYVESEMSNGHWLMTQSLTMADCAALPALYYANRVAPFSGRFPACSGYLERLARWPAAARTMEEAAPYMPMFPLDD